MTNGNDMAMPSLDNEATIGLCLAHRGLTKRELFSMAAMQGLLASNSPISEIAKDCAPVAVMYADALIDALNKKEE